MAIPNREMQEAFIAHLQHMIDDLGDEWTAYVEARPTSGRRLIGEMVDITQQSIEQNDREIEALERAVADHKQYWGL